MTRRQYRFLPRQLEFRRLPRWRTLRLGRLVIFLLGVVVGVWGGAYLLFQWRPSPALQAAIENQEAENEHLAILTAQKDSMERLTLAADSVERRIYQQIVPPAPAESVQAETTARYPHLNALSEEVLTWRLAQVEYMLRSLIRSEEILQSPELRSARLPRRLPCDCPDMGAGPRELIHPLTGQPQRHEGIDFLISEGKPVRATAEGLVRTIEGSRTDGMRIIIQHTPDLATLYYPVNPEVQPGQWVSAGSVIGTVVRLPLGRMPLLHYEVLVDGKPTDPFPYLWGALTLSERLHRKHALLLQPNGLH